MRAKLLLGAVVFGVMGAIAACGSGNNGSGFTQPGGGDGGDHDGDVLGGEGGILSGGDGGTKGDGGAIVGDPVNCADAKTSKSYVGCDYWPTVTANGVWSVFDYAVVVSNVGATAANVTVSGGALASPQTATVAPGALEKIYLPWVPALKGGDADNCGDPPSITNSVIAAGGGYHLVSSTPVVVYQFNALEYKGAGGPTGKSWAGAACPGNSQCNTGPNAGATVGCFSFSNDASLLLPSTAMTLNYRVSGHQGVGSAGSGTNTFFTVTATVDNTHVTTQLAPAGSVLASTDNAIAATAGGSILKFTLAHAGDVAEVIGTTGATADFSGSLVQADNAIEVITGTSAVTIPSTTGAADHTEQIVLPAETLGKHYVVSMPDKPGGGIGVGVVRFYGNEDGTTLTWNGTTPSGCPTAINSGEMKECTIGKVGFTGAVTSSNVEVTGDKEFGVALFQEGAGAYGIIGSNSEGDPSETVLASVEQYRLKYLFLAPTDYDQSYADIVGTSDAAPVLDGAPVTATFSTIGSGPYGVWRVTLNGGPKSDGAHTLTSSSPVGLQVVGYGDYTSYQYPGGLNLNQIAPSPPPPR
ncbi:MAG: IgGFc-binding protein [Polyangiaceae bacterium]